MKSARFFKNQKGFTLIELLVVIGILAILLSIVLIAINPARQFGQANDTRRRSDVTAILNAVGAYSADHKGVLPAGIPVDDPLTPTLEEDALPLCRDTATPANCVDICAVLVTDYIPAIPQDPQTGTGTSIDNAACADTLTDYVTGYTIVQDADGRVTIAAPDYEGSDPISNTR